MGMLGGGGRRHWTPMQTRRHGNRKAQAARCQKRRDGRSPARDWVATGGPGAEDTLAERLRRRPAKPMGSPRVGSNPTGVVCCLRRCCCICARLWNRLGPAWRCGKLHAVSEDRTHDLRIMRPTRCQLRYHRRCCRCAPFRRPSLSARAHVRCHALG